MKLRFICEKCGAEQKPDKKQSNKQWSVFPNKPCKCGGRFIPNVSEKGKEE